MRALRGLVPVALLAVIALAGCSAVDVAGLLNNASQQDAADSEAFEGATALDRLTGCDDIASLVAPHIDGLAPDPENGIDEYGAYCAWNAPEGITEFSQIRSVEVIVSPTGVTDVPSKSDLELGGLAIHPDAGIEALGGIAYSMSAETAVAAVIVTAVRVPGLDIDIVGGQWEDYPSLDTPAAIGVAKSILGA